MFDRINQYRLSRVLVVCCATLSFLISACVAQRWQLYWYWWVLPAAALFVVSMRRHNIVCCIALCLCAVGAGMWRGTVFTDKLAVYDAIEGQKVTIRAVANSDAVYGRHYQLTFDARDAHVMPEETALLGTLTVSGFGESAVFKGDTILVTGTIHRSLGNNVARMSYAQLHVVSHHSTVIDTVRRTFAAGIQSALPEPVASFGLGLLIGQRNTLPETVAEQLKVVGLTHIIAVSGYNLMIMLRAARRIMEKRSKYQFLCLSLLLMTSFLLLAGSSPSIVRASVVCVLSLIAWYYGRTISPFVLILVAACITSYANPLFVWGNISWYLSFLAFFGALVIAPLVTRRIYGMRQPGLVQGMIIESLCAEVMTLPYILYIFGQMSTMGLAGNVLVAAFVPLAMLLSLIAGLAGMWIPFVAGWLAWPATLVMTYMLDIAALLSQVPHAFIENIGFSRWMLVASYGIVGVVLLVIHYRNKVNYAIITDKTTPI